MVNVARGYFMKFAYNKFAVLLGGAVLLLGLGGCGGGSSSSPTSTTLHGMALAGPFLSGNVCAYQVSNGAKGALLGTCTSIVAATSSFSVDVGTYTGDVLVEVSNATYDDEANPNDNVTGTPLTGTLRNLIHVGGNGGTVNLAVTPLTEAALRLAGAHLDDAAVRAAIAQLAALLPLGPNLDLRRTPPAADSADGLAYREALRALSQLQWGGGSGPFHGDLGGFLSNLVGQLGGANTLSADLLAQLNSGMNSDCAITAAVLTCSVASSGGNSGGGNSGVSLSPATGVAGTRVTVSGIGMATYAAYQPNQIKFGTEAGTGYQASFTGSTASVSALVPSGLAAGSYTVTYVSAGGGQAPITVGTFVVTDAGGGSSGGGGGNNTPAVTSYTPGTGAVGSTVTLSGSNLGKFTPAPLVKFGTTTATVSTATATSISVTVPAGLAAGSVAITLSNFDGTGVVSVGNFTVTASAGDGSNGGAGGGSGTGSGGNTTTGTAANGTPALDPTKCASSISLGSAGAGLTMTMYLACGANAVADFSGVTLVDFTDGMTCTASYSAGVLTVAKGPLTAFAALNGDKGSDSMTTLSNGTTETISILSPQDKTSTTSNTIATVTWNAAGAVKQIQGGATAIGGAYQTFNCFQP